jgi:hypothetical protein
LTDDRSAPAPSLGVATGGNLLIGNVDYPVKLERGFQMIEAIFHARKAPVLPAHIVEPDLLLHVLERVALLLCWIDETRLLDFFEPLSEQLLGNPLVLGLRAFLMQVTTPAVRDPPNSTPWENAAVASVTHRLSLLLALEFLVCEPSMGNAFSAVIGLPGY